MPESILHLIGNTPMVDVSALSPNKDVAIMMKLEGKNPGGSVKDRVALKMVEQAEADGVLKPPLDPRRPTPDQIIIEPTSGNTGIGLAMVCKVKGYRLKVVLPTNVSLERRALLEVWGAEIIESPGSQGSNGAVRRALEIAKEHLEWVMLYQYANHANPDAHYAGTGPEIWRDCPQVSHFVAGLGTSGTLLGVGKYLKERNPAVQIWAVEPPAGETVDGLRNLDDGYIPPIFEELGGATLLDRKTVVRPKESIEWTRALAETCGLFVGLSTGAAMAGAVKCANHIASSTDGSPPPRTGQRRATIVVISADDGWKYLSTGAWTDDIDTVVERASQIIYF